MIAFRTATRIDACNGPGSALRLDVIGTAATGAASYATSEVGLPVVCNIEPSSDLGPFISRLFVTTIDQGEDDIAEEIQFNEAAMVQVPLTGDWSWLSGTGEWRAFTGPMLFGPRERAMPVRARGAAAIVGFAIRPSGWLAFDARPASAVVDTAEGIPDAWSAAFTHLPRMVDGHAAIIAALENIASSRIAMTGRKADAKAAELEAMVQTESNISVPQAASHLAMTAWKFDQFVRRHFGHGPKVVLRRSRFLDMAGVIHGVATEDTDALAPVRFYDASHLNREFRTFVAMTPGRFARANTPLLNAELAARQALFAHAAAAQTGGYRSRF